MSEVQKRFIFGWGGWEVMMVTIFLMMSIDKMQHGHTYSCTDTVNDMRAWHPLTHSLALPHKAPTWLPRPDPVLQSLSWPGQVDRDTTIAVLQCRFSRCRAHAHPVTRPTFAPTTHPVTHPTPASIAPDNHSSFTCSLNPDPASQSASSSGSGDDAPSSPAAKRRRFD